MSERVWELSAIARRLCVGEPETVLAYARLWRDPLRLHRRFGRYWMFADRIDRWHERRRLGNTCPRLRTMVAIGEKLGMSDRTARRYSRRACDPLPIEWDRHGAWAYVDALTDWYQAQDERVRAEVVSMDSLMLAR